MTADFSGADSSPEFAFDWCRWVLEERFGIKHVHHNSTVNSRSTFHRHPVKTRCWSGDSPGCKRNIYQYKTSATVTCATVVFLKTGPQQNRSTLRVAAVCAWTNILPRSALEGNKSAESPIREAVISGFWRFRLARHPTGIRRL